jgi:hypothetical protein
MRSDRNKKSRLSRRLADLVILATAFVLPAAVAAAADLKDLAAKPQDYLGKEVEVAGYCVKGGVNGDVLGYECTTEGSVYVDASNVEPAAAKQKVDESCKSKEQDATCRATIRFTPHSFTTSTKVEPNKTITIFNADKAELSF